MREAHISANILGFGEDPLVCVELELQISDVRCKGLGVRRYLLQFPGRKFTTLKSGGIENTYGLKSPSTMVLSAGAKFVSSLTSA